MKNTIRIFISVASILLLVVNCSNGQNNTDAPGENEWPAMDAFHMMMAEAYHPYADSANLQPVKEHAPELKAEADKWAALPLPERVNNEQVKHDLAMLQANAAALVDAVKTGDEAGIAGALEALHNAFHKLQEAWYRNDHGNKHVHHH